MVNKNRDIVSMLDDRFPLSGETLGKKLGISRVAVWKRIKKLQEEGYPVISGRAGYLLDGTAPLPLESFFPEEFPYPVRFTPRVSSTMDQARLEEERSPKLFIAGSQETGRGRRGRRWESPEGGLYASLLLFPETDFESAIVPVMALSVALTELLREEYRLPAAVSWPNDIMIGGGKAGGVLTELHGRYDILDRQILGIGVNVLGNPGVPEAVSLSTARGGEATSRPVSPAPLAASLFTRFHRIVTDLEREEIVSRWKSCSGTVGRMVRVERSRGGELAGRAVALGDDGSLVIRTAGGRTEAVRDGECRLAREEM